MVQDDNYRAEESEEVNEFRYVNEGPKQNPDDFAPVSGRHSGRSSHSHRRRRYRSRRRTALIVCLSLVLVGILVIAGCGFLEATGKRSLYENRVGEASPTLAEAPTAVAEKEEEYEYVLPETTKWDDRWIRYHGKVYQYNEDILTLFLMGIDTDKKVAPAADAISGGQADGLYLMVMNPHTAKLSLIAINRNTMVDMDILDTDGSVITNMPAQICLVHGYGDGMELSCEKQTKAVSDLLYNLPIHAYASLNMGAVPTLNDAVGGVTVRRMTYENGEIIYGDEETLYGKDAYRYIRSRGSDFGSANYRLEKQKEYLNAFISKLGQNFFFNHTATTEIYTAISPYMVTDIDLTEALYLATQVSSYDTKPAVFGLDGETVMGDNGYEEFYPDDIELYDLIIKVFYEEVDLGGN